MTMTLTDERPAHVDVEALRGVFNFYIGAGVLTPGRNGRTEPPCGPAHMLVNGEHYRYEQYQAHTLWGLRRMTRREIVAWRIKKALRRPV